ncbi:MAG: DUF1598 domain-containing protein [Planctomycetota bacterium]
MASIRASLSVCAILLSLSFTSPVTGQQLEDCLKHGEFSLALNQVQNQPASLADSGLQKIAFAQILGGSPQGAWQSASQISNSPLRNHTLGELQTWGGLFQPDKLGRSSSSGGVTEADYQPLIDLIQSTIAPDEWADTGNGDGTIQPWPAGVFVDPSGALRRINTETSGKLSGLREVLRGRPEGIESSLNAELRVISLRQLERAAELSAAKGEPLSPWVRNLGGLVSVSYIVAQPEKRDVLLVGPAGPWKLDSEGRPVSVSSGKPVLQLDDLVACLRNAQDWNGVFGCSITPRADRLAAAKEFLATTKLTGGSFRDELRTTLGQQDVEVFGIAPDSHLASVLVEADYRMKLIGMGIEPSIPEVPSYLARVELLPDGTAPPLDVARWWFTLNFDQLDVDDQRLVFGLKGPGVKVLAETEFINAQGERIHTGIAVGPTKAFADDFTEHFDKLAKKYPIYGQLRAAFELAMVAAIFEREQLASRSGWEPTFFASPRSKGELRYQVATAPVARTVESVMNHRVIRARNGNKTSVHTLVGVSGGVHCDFAAWLDATSGERSRSAEIPQAVREVTSAAAEGDRWWWD